MLIIFIIKAKIPLLKENLSALWKGKNLRIKKTLDDFSDNKRFLKSNVQEKETTISKH